MLKKIAKTALFVSILAAILSAGTVSALQLRKDTNFAGFCPGSCSATIHCSSTCFCRIINGTSGFCVKP